MVEYSADKTVAFCEGYRFRKDKKTGYYLSSKKTDAGKRERLHVFVWRRRNGAVPVGYHVHHADEDKGNNELSNLECIPSGVHESYHRTEYSRLHRDDVARHLKEKATPMAVEWHKSEAGHKWHKEHPPVVVMSEFVCAHCGCVYKAANRGVNRYCSGRCKAAARRLRIKGETV